MENNDADADIQAQIRQAELKKIKAEKKKLDLEAQEIETRLKPLRKQPGFFAKLLVGGFGLAALLGGWGIDYALDVIEMAKSRSEQLAFEKEKLEQEKKEQAQQIAELTAGLDQAARSVSLQTKDGETSKTNAGSANKSEKDPRPSAKRPTIVLRTEPGTFSNPEVYRMIRNRGFNVPAENIFGHFSTNLRVVQLENRDVVVDETTGLMWQQAGSDRTMTRNEALTYVKELNTNAFAGFSNWRLPTIEEVLSLMEKERKNGILYISELFSNQQRWITTSDNLTANSAWGVVFYEGKLYVPTLGFPYWVRAVRTNS